jgi:Flp pilus assembly protein TadG
MTTIDTAAPRASVFARRFNRLLARYGGDRRGVAAVEFAMLLPMMLTLYLGSVEVSTGVAVNRKVTLTTRTLADLTSQYTDVTNADISNILNASSDIMAPYPVSGLSAVVSEVTLDANGNATVVWSDTLNGTARSVGQTVTIPPGLAVPNTYLILAEVSYSYNPSFGYVLTHNITLNDQMYMRPRQSTSIQRTAS